MEGSLVSELAIEAVGGDVFRARLGGWNGRSFGGSTLARAALAAAQTCDGRSLHSLHAYFLRRVPPEVPIEFCVERLSQGRRLAHRRVQVRFEGRVLCEVSASFTTLLEGLAYQDVALPPALAGPDGLLPDVEVARLEGWEEGPPPEIEWRWLEYPWRAIGPGEATSWRAWVRPRSPLPGPAPFHMAALVYLSDCGSQGAVERRFAGGFAHERFASLDHAVWLHRPVCWEDWWLVATRSDVAAGGRTLTQREIFTREGVLIASVTQEALFGDARSS